MNELEIARQMGASAFLVYIVLKTTPSSTVRDIVIESGLNETTVRTAVAKLVSAGFISSRVTKVGTGGFLSLYTVKEEINGNLH